MANQGSIWRMGQELVDKEELARKMGVCLNFKLTPGGGFLRTTPAERAEILANLGKENKEEVTPKAEPKPEPYPQVKADPYIKKEHGGAGFRGHRDIKREVKAVRWVKQEPGCSSHRAEPSRCQPYHSNRSGRDEVRDRGQKRPFNSVEPQVPQKVIKAEPGLEETGSSGWQPNQPANQRRQPTNPRQPTRPNQTANPRPSTKPNQQANTRPPSKPKQPAKPNQPAKSSQPSKPRPPAKMGPSFEELMAIAAKKQTEPFKLPSRPAPKPFAVKQEVFNEDEWRQMREEKKEKKRAMMLVKQEPAEEPLLEPPVIMRRIKEEPVEEPVPTPAVIMRSIKEEPFDPFLAEMELQIGAYETERGLQR
ncbi:unnamed protein product [Bursaphelenchus okinawaensis]|uniref:Uncharacterized protein n=1 Tax=Bursaphelenchus okinawaensis TaxID=465554 RepID=A0A811KG62_9BILA|nr:unnamed protein product [Bursaphelenchus okinawaensis]CAG9101638.1 unnamed protein product [Bursaphelenchus okinawaensis]